MKHDATMDNDEQLLQQEVVKEDDLPYDSKTKNFNLGLRTSHTQIYASTGANTASGAAGQTFTYGDDQD